MKMTQQEYEELIANFAFLEDKAAACFKEETSKVLEQLKNEYQKYVVKY